MKYLLQNKGVNTLFLFLILPLLFSSLSFSSGSEPVDVMRDAIDKFIKIINSKEYKTSKNKEEFEKELRGIVKSVFDYREFSESTLGGYWGDFNKEEKEEFISLFTEFLSKGLFKRIPKEYKNVEIEKIEQEPVSQKNKMKVTVITVSGTDKTYMLYYLIKKNGSWKCYDMIINRIQIIPLYKAQLAAILEGSKPAKLIKRLKEEIERLDKNQELKHLISPEKIAPYNTDYQTEPR